MEETVKQRLMMFKDYLGIGQAKFEKLAGLSNAPWAVKLQSIIYAFPGAQQESGDHPHQRAAHGERYAGGGCLRVGRVTPEITTGHGR